MLSTVNSKAWNDPAHAYHFDYLATFPTYLLKKHYDSFNEIRLFRKKLNDIRPKSLYEIGCATGEFSRFLSIDFDNLSYKGFDISEPSIEAARKKYPNKDFNVVISNSDIEKFEKADVVFCRDVVLHQEKPYEFLGEILNMPKKALVLRLRTREVGDTCTTIENSCQRHYGCYWVPYIVLNTEEMIDFIAEKAPNVKEIIISRHFEVLGGQNGRFLPKDLYYSETKTAETAVLCIYGDTPRKEGEKPKVSFEDKADRPSFKLSDRIFLRLSNLFAGRAPSTPDPNVAIEQ